MKKKLLVLPLIGGLLLSGCDLSSFGMLGDIISSLDILGLFSENPDEALEELGTNVKTEVDGYKIATKIKDGGKYVLGVYRVQQNTMRYVDGGYHTDSNGEYPFYMSTSTNVSQAAEVTIKTLGGGKFGMKLTCPGKPWNGKYIGVYGAVSAYGKSVMSIALLDSPTQKSFVTINDKKTVEVNGEFKYYVKYDDMPACAPAASLKYAALGDTEATPKFLGTGHASEGEDYISVDCKSYEMALQTGAYDIAHLYEKK